jgi:hypothetical protein
MKWIQYVEVQSEMTTMRKILFFFMGYKTSEGRQAGR